MKKKYSKAKDILITLALIAITTISIISVAFAIYIGRYIVPKAEIDIAGLTMNLSSVVYYEDKTTGEYIELERLHAGENRQLATFDEIPENLKKAFIAIEDERFYKHSGVDWKRTIGAAINWVVPIRSGFGGGSTITQQLVKNLTSDDDFKVTRKITEILRALSLDKALEKDQILELYLNTIYLGRNAYGIRAASQTYFNKELNQLSLAEMAVIAGITKNPSYYDPFRFPENIKERQELILDQMEKQGYITKEERDSAKAEILDYKKEENAAKLESKQSYFVDALVEEVLADLMEEKGYSKQVATQLLFSGGLKIYSTVDINVQKTLEKVFTDTKNIPSIKAKNGETPQASMSIMDPTTGKVVGIVGGVGEKTGDRVLNRATQTKRQPGSAIKPISVYAPALDEGIITPISVYDDAPYNFTVNENGWPKNYYSGFRGRMTVLEAVADSVNTVAVKVLSDVTPKTAFNFANSNLGVKSLVSKQTLSNGKTQSDIDLAPLALGGLTNGMSVLEMTASYVPFANDGSYYEPTTYTKVENANGDIILDHEIKSQKAFKNSTTPYYMRQLLGEVTSTGTGTRARITGMQTLGKTGTTTSDYDRWFVGATPYYVGATWFGYDTPQTVKGVSSNPALALWKKVMDDVHKDLANKNFETSKDFVTVSYCRDSGLLPNEYCSQDVRGTRVSTARVAQKDAPTQMCNLHKAVPIDKTTGGVATQYCPKDLVETRVLLDLTRLFPKAISLPDEKYTVTYENEPVGSGVRVLRGDNPTYTGVACKVHDDKYVPETPKPEETVPDNDPEDPVIPEDNTGDNEDIVVDPE